jgi:hypothetical protein
MDRDDWNVEDYLSRIVPKSGSGLKESFSVKAAPMIEDHEVTDEILHDCYAVMAEVVTRYGDTYLPIFERIHKELEARKKRQALLDKALRLSRRH